jgi:hypothetical protein
MIREVYIHGFVYMELANVSTPFIYKCVLIQDFCSGRLISFRFRPICCSIFRYVPQAVCRKADSLPFACFCAFIKPLPIFESYSIFQVIARAHFLHYLLSNRAIVGKVWPPFCSNRLHLQSTRLSCHVLYARGP